VALVFNPSTGHVSPQYHVMFDDDFTTVPFMEKGERPPNWEDLCRRNAESSTDESVDLAQEWLSGMTDVVGTDGTIVGRPNGLGSRITDPYAVLPAQAQPAGDYLIASTDLTNVSSNLDTASEGERSHLSSSSRKRNVPAAAANIGDSTKRGKKDSKVGPESDLGAAFDDVATDNDQTSESEHSSCLSE